jgi:hypothetical protein
MKRGTTMETVDAARCLWRAELHEIAAAAHEQEGRYKAARESYERAQSERQYADLLEELNAAKTSGDRATLQDVKLKLSEYRKSVRSMTAPSPVALHHLEEPSNEELMNGV